ncbi:MAG: hypothetical protein J6B16_00020 [Clostridia bacterium]|nr:hypothetical protein [Clostridia bacterium]
MDNVIYGFDNELMISLIDYLKQNKNLTLTTVFKNFALQHDKSWGTIRNLYYAIIKKAGEDEDFKKRYLTGVDISVNKIDKFTNVEEKELIKSIILERSKTRSTRKAVYNLSGGNDKVALRYQNKFRSAIKNNPTLINEVNQELSSLGDSAVLRLCKVTPDTEVAIERVRGEINKLVDRLFLNVKKENSILKKENLSLKEQVEKLTLLVEALKNKTNIGLFTEISDNLKTN